jgi:hypothetical protein
MARNLYLFELTWPALGVGEPTISTAITLRDLFAGLALAGIAANKEFLIRGADRSDCAGAAVVAYALADALLAELGKEPHA